MKKGYVKETFIALLGVFFMFVFGHVCPMWGPVTRLGVHYLGIMIGWIVMCACGLPMSMASVMSMAACTLPGFFTPATAISSSIGSAFCVLVIFIFVLVHVFETTGTGEFLVRYFLSRKFVNGRPYLFTAIFFLTVIVIGSVIGSFGIIVLTITILNNVANVAGMEKQHDWIRFLLICVVALSGVTEILYPFKPYAQLYCSIFNASLKSAGAECSGTVWLIVALTIAAFSFVLMMFLAKFVFHFDLRKIEQLDVSELQSGEFRRMKPNQIIVLFAVLISFFHPFIVMLLPKGSYVHFFMSSMGQTLFMGLVLALLSLIRVDGKPVMDPVAAFAKGVNWHVVFATGSVLLVGSAMANEKCGIAAWLLSMFSDSLGHMDIVPVMIVVALLSCFVTQFFSNSATAIIFLTALAPLAVVMLGKGVNVSVFPPIIGIGTLTACLLPSGSGQSATMLGTEIFQGADGQAWALSKGLIVLAAETIAVVAAGVLCIVIL